MVEIFTKEKNGVKIPIERIQTLLEHNNVIVLHFTFRTKSNRLTDMIIIYC